MSKELAIQQDQLAPIEGDERGLQLRSLNDLASFAITISNSGLAPQGFKTPDAIMVAIQHGMELGLSPMASLQSIAVINGRPTLYGDGLMAVARAHPACEDVIETFERGEGDDNMKAVCEVRRKGCVPVVRSFSVAQAKKAALWGKSGPWSLYPQRMLQMRARAFALRDAFADALKGFRCTEEERDIEPREVRGRVVETKLILPGEPVEESPVSGLGVERADTNASEQAATSHTADGTAERASSLPLDPVNEAGEFEWEAK